MYVCLRLALVIFIFASSCGGYPTISPGGDLQQEDLPKDEFSDVVRLLNSSAKTESEERAKLEHAVRASPHGAHKHPLAPADSLGTTKSAKKLTKKSPVKKYRPKKSKTKHTSKHTKKIEPVDSLYMSDSPANERVKEVLTRRRISSRLTSKVIAESKEEADAKEEAETKQDAEAKVEIVTDSVASVLPQLLPYPQYPLPSYQPYQPQPYYQPYYNSYPQPTPYPAPYNPYSFVPAAPLIPPQYSYHPDNNNWDNNIQISQIPSEAEIKIPDIEPPKMHWTAEIEYPNMPPIVITDQNYTDNPHADVNIIPATEKSDIQPAKPAWKPPTVHRPRTSRSGAPPPIIWSHGIPYMPLTSLQQAEYLDSPHNPMMPSYNSIASPYNFATPPVYYHPPSNLPYSQNTPVQTWLPSSQPYYPTWPVEPQPHHTSNQHQHQHGHHEVNIIPAQPEQPGEGQEDAVEEGGIYATVFQGSKELTGDNVEVNIIPVDKNVPDVDGSDEMPAAVPAVSKEDDDDEDDS